MHMQLTREQFRCSRQDSTQLRPRGCCSWHCKIPGNTRQICNYTTCRGSIPGSSPGGAGGIPSDFVPGGAAAGCGTAGSCRGRSAPATSWTARHGCRPQLLPAAHLHRGCAGHGERYEATELTGEHSAQPSCAQAARAAQSSLPMPVAPCWAHTWHSTQVPCGHACLSCSATGHSSPSCS